MWYDMHEGKADAAKDEFHLGYRALQCSEYLHFN